MKTGKRLVVLAVALTGLTVPACGSSDAQTPNAGTGGGIAEAGPEPRPEAGPEPQPEAGPEPQPEAGSDHTPEAGPEPQPEAGPEGGTDCLGTQPATLVSVTGGYSIDETEVTRCQYQAWLATSPADTGQPPECWWNAGADAFTPGCEWPPGAKGGHPVVCVDWCDVYAYCQAVGKRLCGKIGGGANEHIDYAEASKSQWYNACTSGGQNDYSYGDTYDGQACNGADKGEGGTVTAGSLTSCESSVSGYTGVYDLNGNVLEWEDSCSGQSGESDGCRFRGGSFAFDGYFLRCDTGYNVDRSYSGNLIGFRCCAP